jgi:hypothetical protein
VHVTAARELARASVHVEHHVADAEEIHGSTG